MPLTSLLILLMIGAITNQSVLNNEKAIVVFSGGQDTSNFF